MSEQSLENYLWNSGRSKIFDEQPGKLVLHNSLTWAVKDISLDTSDNFVTLELWELPSVTCQVPIKSCFVLTNYVAKPRAGARRISYLEIQELNFSYVIGPTPSRIDERGNAHQLSNSWMSPAPMVFWPRGNYVKIGEDSNDTEIPYNKNVGLKPRIYTFTPTNAHSKDFETVHKAMQHLNVRPDIYAQCGNPRFRGAKSWTYTCTAAATDAIYIDNAMQTIVNTNKWNVSIYEWSTFASTTDAPMFEWAIPVKSDEMVVPLSIGADLMGPRASSRYLQPTSFKVGTSPFMLLKQLEDNPLKDNLGITKELETENLKVAINEILNDKKNSIYEERDSEWNDVKDRKTFVAEFVKFVKENNQFASTFPYTHQFYKTHQEKIDSFTDDTRPTQLNNAIPKAFENDNVEATVLEGAEWEFLWNITSESIRNDIETELKSTSTSFKGNVDNISTVNFNSTPSTTYVHQFDSKTNEHIFTTAKSLTPLFRSKKMLQNKTFAFQKSNSVCSWESTPQMLGTFSFLHTTAPMRPKSTTSSHAYKTPIHILDLIEMAYGKGTYPNIMKLMPHKNAVLMLEPELPTQEVLFDLYEHVNINKSQAVLSSAIAAHGPIGVTGPSAITWTVLYEYYYAMKTPQNAFMQYLIALNLDLLDLGGIKSESFMRQTGNLSDKALKVGAITVLTGALMYACPSLTMATAFSAAVFLADQAISMFSANPQPLEVIYGGDSTQLKTENDLLKNWLKTKSVSFGPFIQVVKENAKKLLVSEGDEERALLDELQVVLDRTNMVSAGLIRGGYYFSRIPLNIEPRLQPDSIAFLQRQWNVFSSGKVKLSGTGILNNVRRFLASKIYETLPITEWQDNYRKLLEKAFPKELFREGGKVNQSYLFRLSTANRHRMISDQSLEDILYICEFGWEKIRTVPFHQAELLITFCSNAVAHERWASIPLQQQSGRVITSLKSNLNMVLTTHIRMVGASPLPRPQAPKSSPTAKFRVVIPFGTQTPQSTLQWVTSNPSMCGFGFVAEMTAFGSRALDMPSAGLNDLSRRIATAVALVYARNVLIRSAWLTTAQFGPRFGSNAPIQHRVPDDAPRGLLPTSALAELFTD